VSKVRRHLGIVVCLIVLAVAVTPAAPLGAAGPLLENLRLSLAAAHLSAVPVGRLMRDAGTTT